MASKFRPLGPREDVTAQNGVKGAGLVDVQLQRLRDSIDNLDAALIHLLAERFKCTQEIGELKAANNLPPADPERERVQIARLHRLAEDARLDSKFAEGLLRFIIKEVIRRHKALACSWLGEKVPGGGVPAIELSTSIAGETLAAVVVDDRQAAQSAVTETFGDEVHRPAFVFAG